MEIRLKKIHFIGIGGSGMSGLAQIYHHLGYEVTGSDIKESQIISGLKKIGIKIKTKHSKFNVLRAEIVVISSAIKKNNVELKFAKKNNIPVVPRAKMLAELLRFKKGIAVAGSHGKTTTTSIISHIFQFSNLNPTYVIGGVLSSNNQNSNLGKSDILVCEADESDKSFLYLNPYTAVITNIDNDHLETYKNSIDYLIHHFYLFTENLPFYGYVVLNIDNKNIKKLIKYINRPFLTYVFSKKADYIIENLEFTSGKPNFYLRKNNPNPIGSNIKVNLNTYGQHNIYNSVGAIIVSWLYKITNKKIIDSLKNFGGVHRRFQFIGKFKVNKFTNINLIDDYGHHPTELIETISTAKVAFPNSKIYIVFQPHRYSRTKICFNEFVTALINSDKALLTNIYPAGEKKISQINSKKIRAEILKKRGMKVDVIDFDSDLDLCKIKKKIELNLDNNDLILIMGAGTISKLPQYLKNAWQ